VTIRPPHPAEYAVLGDIVVAAYVHVGALDGDDGYAAELRDVAARVAGAIVLVATDADDDRPLGCVTYVPGPESTLAEGLGPEEASIRMLAVDPAATGRGAGTALAAACVELARAAGRDRIVLHSLPAMSGAQRIYRRLGFRHAVERDWRPSPDSDFVLFCFVLDLAGGGTPIAGAGMGGGARRAGRSRPTRYAPWVVTPDRPIPATDALDLPSGPFAELFGGGRRQRLRPGTIVFAEGDVSNRVVLVLSGRLKVSSFSEDGRETVLGFRTRGVVLGELAAIDGEPHSATVTVTAPSEALVLQADRFLAELRARPDVMLAMLRSVIVRLRDADRKRAEFAALSADGRIAERLIELAAEAAGDGGRDGRDGGRGGDAPTFPITQAELAGWVGCSREAANKALGRFADLGFVELGRGHVTILDLGGLRRSIAT